MEESDSLSSKVIFAPEPVDYSDLVWKDTDGGEYRLHSQMIAAQCDLFDFDDEKRECSKKDIDVSRNGSDSSNGNKGNDGNKNSNESDNNSDSHNDRSNINNSSSSSSSSDSDKSNTDNNSSNNIHMSLPRPSTYTAIFPFCRMLYASLEQKLDVLTNENVLEVWVLSLHCISNIESVCQDFFIKKALSVSLDQIYKALEIANHESSFISATTGNSATSTATTTSTASTTSTAATTVTTLSSAVSKTVSSFLQLFKLLARVLLVRRTEITVEDLLRLNEGTLLSLAEVFGWCLRNPPVEEIQSKESSPETVTISVCQVQQNSESESLTEREEKGTHQNEGQSVDGVKRNDTEIERKVENVPVIVFSPKPKGKSDVIWVDKEGGEYHVHSQILSQRSPVLRALHWDQKLPREESRETLKTFFQLLYPVSWAEARGNFAQTNILSRSSVLSVWLLLRKYECSVESECAKFVDLALESLPVSSNQNDSLTLQTAYKFASTHKISSLSQRITNVLCSHQNKISREALAFFEKDTVARLLRYWFMNSDYLAKESFCLLKENGEWTRAHVSKTCSDTVILNAGWQEDSGLHLYKCSSRLAPIGFSI